MKISETSEKGWWKSDAFKIRLVLVHYRFYMHCFTWKFVTMVILGCFIMVGDSDCVCQKHHTHHANCKMLKSVSLMICTPSISTNPADQNYSKHKTFFTLVFFQSTFKLKNLTSSLFSCYCSLQNMLMLQVFFCDWSILPVAFGSLMKMELWSPLLHLVHTVVLSCLNYTLTSGL